MDQCQSGKTGPYADRIEIDLGLSGLLRGRSLIEAAVRSGHWSYSCNTLTVRLVTAEPGFPQNRVSIGIGLPHLRHNRLGADETRCRARLDETAVFQAAVAAAIMLVSGRLIPSTDQGPFDSPGLAFQANRGAPGPGSLEHFTGSASCRNWSL